MAEHTLTLADDCPNTSQPTTPSRAEKYIKALLVLRGIDFPFTHNIARLLEMCSEPK